MSCLTAYLLFYFHSYFFFAIVSLAFLRTLRSLWTILKYTPSKRNTISNDDDGAERLLNFRENSPISFKTSRSLIRYAPWFSFSTFHFSVCWHKFIQIMFKWKRSMQLWMCYHDCRSSPPVRMSRKSHIVGFFLICWQPM